MEKIEGGIKKRKIVDNGAGILKKKMIIFDSMFMQWLGKREAKKNHIWHGMNLSRIFLTHRHTPKYPSLVHLYLGCPFGKMAFQSNKRKKTKVYHSFLMSYGELLPILIQNYKISIIPTKSIRPPYPRRYDPNARCEYHRGVGGTFHGELHDIQRQGSITDQRRSDQIQRTC